MDLRSPKRRETQPLSNVLLAMPQSASQQKAHVVGHSHNQRTSRKMVSEKEVDRWEKCFKEEKTFDVVNWNKKTFSFQWTRGTSLVQNISFCWLFNTQKHWIYSTFIFHEKMTKLIIAYPNIVRPRNMCYLTKSLQLTQRSVKVAVLNLKGVA